MKKFLSIILAVLVHLYSFGQQYSQRWTDINYAGDRLAYHNMDIYLPVAAKAKYPVIVLIYGSGWGSNSSKGADMNTLGARLLTAGFAVVTPNHRSSSDARFPAQINDIKAVVRFIRGNTVAYKFDSSFVGITGSSSGGHLAALTGTSRYVKSRSSEAVTMDIEGNLGSFTQYSSSVNAVCDWYGPTELLKMDSCGSGINHNAAGSPESRLIGGEIQNNKDRVALANPITYVDRTDPPFLLIHGNADNSVPDCESNFLHLALRKAGVQSEYILVPNGQHGGNITQSTANIQRMVVFFTQELNETVTSTDNMSLENFITVDTGDNSIIVNGNIGSTVLNYNIMDASGKIVLAGVLNGNEIGIRNLNDGMFVFTLVSKDGKMLTKKFIRANK